MKTKTILLVQDNLDDVALTLRALKTTDIAHSIVVAEDGLEALDYLFGTGKYKGRNISDKPAVILLDLRLPKLDGLEVLRCIRADKRTRALPVVILTSSEEEGDILKSYDLGANSYMQKPVDFNKFVEVVRNIEMYWLVMNEQPPFQTEV